MSAANVEHVKNRGDGTEPAVDPIAPGADLSNALLQDADLAGRTLIGCNLSGADLSGANLTGADLTGANLQDAQLSGATLNETRFLGADLRRADLTGASTRRALFGQAKLSDAVLFNADLGEATLSHADLSGADLRVAKLPGARLRQANLTGADLSRADLREADLTKARVTRAGFRDADLRHARLRGVEGYGDADWIGVDIVDADFAGAYLLRRSIMDQNYLHEYRNKSRTNAIVYYIWSITSDCGRSYGRWALWTIAVAILFAFVYTVVGLDFGPHQTGMSPFYFSVVTLTTLGYGDIVPTTETTQIVAMFEVIIGYVMLGGLLSIFATKMGRRAE